VSVGTLTVVDDRSVGLAIRRIRRHRGWRQVDLATHAKVSQTTVSLIERGHLLEADHRAVRRLVEALDGRCSVEITWRGAMIDRLLDEGHSGLVEMIVQILHPGWEVAVEVSFSIYGERGSVDVLAWHAPTGTLLIVEVKTELASVEEALRRLDVKARLGAEIAKSRGWRPKVIARLFVIGDSGAARRAVAARSATFTTSYPTRGWDVRRWLSSPAGPMAGILFLPRSGRDADRRAGGGSHRVRQSSARRASAPLTPAAG
jgi:transcriptional regulator with XRE-family HTH domain